MKHILFLLILTSCLRSPIHHDMITEEIMYVKIRREKDYFAISMELERNNNIIILKTDSIKVFTKKGHYVLK